ncbi:MAG: response regulator transcription factor [Chloroflexota bacterium]|nr:response regulator transcription factor [Chloroflexota bacterium]
MSEKIIRVLLVDDHPALRLGLRVLLERAPDVELVGEAENGAEALTLIEASRPDVDVVVLDCELPEMEGVEVAQEIRRRGLSARVLALSSYDDERYVRGMLEAGAVGYLLKDEAPGVIVTAVRAAARGEGYFSPTVTTTVTAWTRGERPGGLTERELEVLRLVAEGLPNKQIASQLHVVERTAQFHVSNVLRKLGVTSRVAAAVWATEHGIAP